MTEEQATVLIEASLQGVRQIKGALWDPDGGFCALGLLEARLGQKSLRSLYATPVHGCPECGARRDARRFGINTEAMLIVHLNNDHGWSFLDIARKLGPREVTA